MIRLQQISGQRGRVRVGYHTAATLGSFTLKRSDVPDEWKVEARVEQSDPFWLSRGPLALELEVGERRLFWPAANLVVVEGAVTGAVTGAPEKR